MGKRPTCLPGYHQWVEQVGQKGSRYTVCAICDMVKQG